MPDLRNLHIIFLLLATLVCISLAATGQIDSSVVRVKWSSDNPDWVAEQSIFKSDLQLSKYLSEVRNDALLSGNAGFSVDTLPATSQDSTLRLNLFFGPTFRYNKIEITQEDLFSSLGLDGELRKLRKNPLLIEQYLELYEKAISKLENSGYPFATVSMNEVALTDSSISANLQIEKNQLITLDSIVVKSTDEINEKYLRYYLALQKGSPYNEQKMKRVEGKIREIPFLKTTKSPQVVFFKDYAQLFLYVEEKSANSFNGILGLQQDEETSDVQFTGDVELRLVNSLKRGETFYLNWKKLQTQTQTLKANIKYPFLFGTPFGVDGAIDIYRRDTTFTNLMLEGGVFYQLQGYDYYKVFVSREVSNQLSQVSTPEDGFESLSDTRVNYYGLGLHRENLDYRFNPRRGWQVELQASAGQKRYTLEPDNEGEDPTEQTVAQYRTSGFANFFIPIGGRGTIKIGTQSGWLQSEALFENEMFRIGGIQSLRGFFEQSIQANLYAIGTAEFRFILEENSYASIFYDHGYYENNNTNTFTSDDPFGVGAGFSFETKAGIFSINYAIGQQFENPFLFRNSRVHFGFVNLF
ncbi:BamA/TamA family outer membrane protein [Halocola ammonii]